MYLLLLSFCLVMACLLGNLLLRGGVYANESKFVPRRTSSSLLCGAIAQQVNAYQMVSFTVLCQKNKRRKQSFIVQTVSSLVLIEFFRVRLMYNMM